MYVWVCVSVHVCVCGKSANVWGKQSCVCVCVCVCVVVCVYVREREKEIMQVSVFVNVCVFHILKLGPHTPLSGIDRRMHSYFIWMYIQYNQ